MCCGKKAKDLRKVKNSQVIYASFLQSDKFSFNPTSQEKQHILLEDEQCVENGLLQFCFDFQTLYGNATSCEYQCLIKMGIEGEPWARVSDLQIRDSKPGLK